MIFGLPLIPCLNELLFTLPFHRKSLMASGGLSSRSSMCLCICFLVFFHLMQFRESHFMLHITWMLEARLISLPYSERQLFTTIPRPQY